MSAKPEKIHDSPPTVVSRELPVSLSRCSSEPLRSAPLSSGTLSSGTLSSEPPVSERQRLENLLKARAAHSACAHGSDARKKLWKVLRDLRAIEKVIKRELKIPELMSAFDEWHRLSSPYLGSTKTRDDYLAEFLSGLTKVRVPTGDGDTINKALQVVSKLTISELPTIPAVRHIS